MLMDATISPGFSSISLQLPLHVSHSGPICQSHSMFITSNSFLINSLSSYPLVNQHSYGKSQFFMGKSTISMAIFNSYVYSSRGKAYLFASVRRLLYWKPPTKILGVWNWGTQDHWFLHFKVTIGSMKLGDNWCQTDDFLDPIVMDSTECQATDHPPARV